MKKFIDIFIIFLLLGTAFFLYTHFFDTPKLLEQWTFHGDGSPQKTYQELLQSKQVQSERDAKSYNLAIESQDIHACENIRDKKEKIKCQDMVRASIALKENRKEQCDSLSNTGIQELCRDNILFVQAGSGNDINICKTISDENIRANCQTSIETKLFTLRSGSGGLDDAFCETLEGELKEQCKARVVHTDDYRTYQNALSSKDDAGCENISDIDLRSQCRDALIFEKAIKTNDPDLCNTISHSEKKTYCYSSISLKEERQTYQSIVSSGDIILCDKLHSPALKRQCHDVIIIANVRTTQEKSLCDNLYNTGMLVTCQSVIRKP